MEQFKQTYFEECEDRIQEAEDGLSLMLDGTLDDATVNQVFRAIHSIKGGAGAFGFDAVVSFSHQFETTLDLVREGVITPDREMCTLFLYANDIVADMIAYEQNGDPIPADYGQDVLESLSKIVQGVLGSDDGGAAQQEASQDHADSGEIIGWRIDFTPHDEVLSSGNDPLFLLRALFDLGECTVEAMLDELPAYSDFDPQRIYCRWVITLNAPVSEDDVREVFDFVEDICDLTLTPLLDETTTQSAAPVADRASPSAKEPKVKASGHNAQSQSQSIRVDLDRIDHLVNLVGEMVIAQSMLQEQARWLPMDVGGKLNEDIENLSRHMRDLQQSVMAVRAQPIKSVFTRMPRIIREVSALCGKNVVLETAGEETEVDKTVLENLVDPLTHMIRNSVDHGIEDPDTRKLSGKSEQGTIFLSARHKSGRILIEVEDDGQGINRDAVMAKAEKQGLIPEDANLSPQDIDNLIFKAGFSTAETVSEVSGRGVGMDVVKKNVTTMGGRISVASTPGEGCKMTLSMPLTLAVMDGMIVSVGSQRFVLPTVNIVESFQPGRDAVAKLTQGVSIIRARGQYVRIVPLYDIFCIDDAITAPDEALLILLESDEGDRIAVMVDDVLGQQQVVIKSLETNFNAVGGISAATILGNGDVALILDITGISDMQTHVDLRDLCTQDKNLKALTDIEHYTRESNVAAEDNADIDALSVEDRDEHETMRTDMIGRE